MNPPNIYADAFFMHSLWNLKGDKGMPREARSPSTGFTGTVTDPLTKWNRNHMGRPRFLCHEMTKMSSSGVPSAATNRSYSRCSSLAVAVASRRSSPATGRPSAFGRSCGCRHGALTPPDGPMAPCLRNWPPRPSPLALLASAPALMSLRDAHGQDGRLPSLPPPYLLSLVPLASMLW